MSYRLALISVLVGCSFHGTGEGSNVDAKPAIDARLVDAPPLLVDVPDGFIFMDAPPDAPPDALPIPMCPSNYGPINGIGMYRISSSTKTWQLASDDCNDDTATGGPYLGFTHLAVITSEAERMGITAPTAVSGNSWIGLSDLVLEGTYVWVTAEPINGYSDVGQRPPWDTSEPDDAGGGEDCVRFKNSFVFEDKPCTMALDYTCECDAFAPN